MTLNGDVRHDCLVVKLSRIFRNEVRTEEFYKKYKHNLVNAQGRFEATIINC